MDPKVENCHTRGWNNTQETYNNFFQWNLVIMLVWHSANFKTFVKSADMAKNKGLIPSRPKQISMHRKQLKAIIESTLPACIEPDMETGAPFRAQAIMANPPSYASTLKFDDN